MLSSFILIIKENGHIIDIWVYMILTYTMHFDGQ